MDALLKATIQSLLTKAIAYCATGIVLYLADLALWGQPVAMQQLPCILVLATLFFAFGLALSPLYLRIMRQGGKRAMGFYILQKGLRLMGALVLLVVYAFAGKENLVAFALNLFVLYIVGMVVSLIYSTRMEHLSRTKQ